jgi:hypothetical protein
LYLLDPRVNISLKLVEERRVVKEGLGLDGVDGNSISRGVALVRQLSFDASTHLSDSLSHNRMD